MNETKHRAEQGFCEKHGVASEHCLACKVDKLEKENVLLRAKVILADAQLGYDRGHAKEGDDVVTIEQIADDMGALWMKEEVRREIAEHHLELARQQIEDEKAVMTALVAGIESLQFAESDEELKQMADLLIESAKERAHLGDTFLKEVLLDFMKWGGVPVEPEVINNYIQSRHE